MTQGGDYALAYTISAAMVGVAIILALVTKPISEEKAQQLSPATV